MDLNVQAFRPVQKAITVVAPSRAKLASSQKDGIKGGAARTKLITSEFKAEIACNASAARWLKQIPVFGV